MATKSAEKNALARISRRPELKKFAARSRSLEDTSILSRRHRHQEQQDGGNFLFRDNEGVSTVGNKRRHGLSKASSFRSLVEKPKSILKTTSAFKKTDSLRSSKGVSSNNDKRKENNKDLTADFKRKMKRNVSFEEMNRWGNGSTEEFCLESFLRTDVDDDEEEEENKVDQMRLATEVKLKQDESLEQMNRWGNGSSEKLGFLGFDFNGILKMENAEEDQENGSEEVGLVSKTNKVNLNSSCDKISRWGNGSSSSDLDCFSFSLDNENSFPVSNKPTLSSKDSKSDVNPAFDSLPIIPHRKRSVIIEAISYGPRFPTRRASDINDESESNHDVSAGTPICLTPSMQTVIATPLDNGAAFKNMPRFPTRKASMEFVNSGDDDAVEIVPIIQKCC